MIPEEGPPQKKSKIRETSLSEPQMIKRTEIDLLYSAAFQLRRMRHFRRFHKDPIRVIGEFEENVVNLFSILAAEKCIQELPDFNFFDNAIENNVPIPYAKVYSMFRSLRTLMRDPLGITNTAFLKSTVPGEDWQEDRLLGDD
jgi:hypothetical protein